jgi:hypothetical protein
MELNRSGDREQLNLMDLVKWISYFLPDEEAHPVAETVCFETKNEMMEIA